MQSLNFEIAQYKSIYQQDVLELLSDVFGYPYSLEYLNTGFSEKFIAINKGRIIGFLEFAVLFQTAEIFMIAVHRDFQGMGVGKKLMEFCLSKLKEQDVKEVYLDVSVKNSRAINFYKSYGFYVLYTRKAYYKNGDDAYLMKKDI